MSQHIVSSFDRDLEAAQAMVVKMGGLVESQVLDAAQALENRDEELAEQVRQRDKQVDQLEEMINTEAARLIALRAPHASDLRVALSVIKIAGSLERVGDYAKNMGKRTKVIADMPSINGSSGAIKRMAVAVEGMLKDSIDSFIQRDANLAADVRARDVQIDQMYNALFREFLTYMMEDPRNITPCMHLHFIAKNIERMGDLCTSIAEQVTYLVTGEMPDDSRPKADSVTDFIPGES
ncbi:phosphate transport system regulatory protein PhoU [Rhodobacter sp. TJ_12]|uniref:phosphate signaling complex protein PhoU n=1 Tax=Rhodobacter sp. TJ_12 TaxID=2029399 RepID=UPI001CBE08AC|nr:phosphate signaling complex protein PhoU [Rhodobacter sp. TJ_12]MBZ4022027.1 phosphate transport system regulatory protein PhoU [Rhodobacter sp. TJ_12]